MLSEESKAKENGNVQDPNPQHGNDNHGHHGRQDGNNGQEKRQTPSHSVSWTKF